MPAVRPVALNVTVWAPAFVKLEPEAPVPPAFCTVHAWVVYVPEPPEGVPLIFTVLPMHTEAGDGVGDAVGAA